MKKKYKIIKLPPITEKQIEEIKNRYGGFISFYPKHKGYSEKRTYFWGSGNENN